MSPIRKKTVVLFTVMAVFVSLPLAVIAGHNQFTDVPDGHTHHTAIGWMLDSGITEGCNPPANDNYCPGDNVTRGQMATFMKRLAENQVVDASTAETAGTAYEATRLDGTSLTATSSASQDTIATLDGLPAGSYVVNATWVGSASGAGAEARIVCDLNAGDSEGQAIANVANDDHLGGQHSMAAVTTATLSSGDAVTLTCHRENETGSQSISRVHIVAHQVNAVVSEAVTG